MSKKYEEIDWGSIQHKVEDMLGNHFWSDLNHILPKRFPNVDLYETDKEGVIVVEVPGLHSTNDIQIKLDANILTVEGNVPYAYEASKQKLKLNERHTGVFSRTVKLPFHYTDEPVRAKYKNGLLEIRLNKIENDQTIAIQFEDD
ncbi:Hsp20/alpha crystallin family protein [Priestia megaterium]|uniref:Hsp20/alpha crystallin family protein n=1 Tax=Priestia megaterium TaxID=1404 RepID=UPI0035E3B139